jgi:hypothetical protein
MELTQAVVQRQAKNSPAGLAYDKLCKIKRGIVPFASFELRRN